MIGHGIKRVVVITGSEERELCNGNCSNSGTYYVPAGSYTVNVWYGSDWTLCQQNVHVPGSGGTTGGGTTGGGTTGGGTTGGGTTGGGTTGGGTTGGGTGCPTISANTGVIYVVGHGIEKVSYTNTNGEKILCQNNCSSSGTYYVPAGTYTVNVWYGNDWTLCQQTVQVPGSGGSTTGGTTGSTTGGTTGGSSGSTTCYVATNTNYCPGNGGAYGGYLILNGMPNSFYTIHYGQFTEYSNGTATLTGRWTNTAYPNYYFDVTFYLSGKYSQQNPKPHFCGRTQSNIHAYSSYYGTLIGGGGYAGVQLQATAMGPDFQVGMNANITHLYDSFGASGWFTVSVISGHVTPGTTSDGANGDININLTASSCSRAKEFTNFNAYSVNRSIELEWVTTTSYRSTKYIIEKSTNGSDFEELEVVKNDTYSWEPTYFTNLDNAPTLGDNFYRLKQVFEDGSYEYSKVKTINFGIDLQAIEAFPNPAQHELMLNLSAYADQPASITISNQFGVIVEERKWEALPSELLQVDLSQYENGIYFLRTKIDRGKFITQKFIVSKMH